MSVRAIIVTYQTSRADATACLKSLRENKVSSIVVVDNSPSKEMKKTAAHYGAQYLPQSHNKGFAAAVNRAAAEFEEDVLLLLNPDATLQPKAREKAERYIKQHSTCGVLGLPLQAPSGSYEVRSFGPIVTPISLITRRLVSQGIPRQPQSVGWVSGGAMMIRSEAWRALGGLDPRYFLYWEDVDFCRRARAAGWKVVLAPPPGVSHRRGASIRSKRKAAQAYDDSADKYFRKHYPKSIWLPLKFLRRCYRLVSPRAQ